MRKEWQVGTTTITAGATKRWSEHRGGGIIGLSWIRLLGGIVFHFSVGRYALYVGHWGPTANTGHPGWKVVR